MCRHSSQAFRGPPCWNPSGASTVRRTSRFMATWLGSDNDGCLHLGVILTRDRVFAGFGCGPRNAVTLFHIPRDVLAVDVAGVDGGFTVLDEDCLANLDRDPGGNKRHLLLVDLGRVFGVRLRRGRLRGGRWRGIAGVTPACDPQRKRESGGGNGSHSYAWDLDCHG